MEERKLKYPQVGKCGQFTNLGSHVAMRKMKRMALGEVQSSGKAESNQRQKEHCQVRNNKGERTFLLQL